MDYNPIEQLRQETRDNNLKSNIFGSVEDNAPEEMGQDYNIIEKMNNIKKNTEKTEDFLEKELFEKNDDLVKRIEKLEVENINLKLRLQEIENFVDKWAKSRTVTQEQINQIRELLNQGKTEMEIVQLTNTSKGTVWRVKNNII